MAKANQAKANKEVANVESQEVEVTTAQVNAETAQSEAPAAEAKSEKPAKPVIEILKAEYGIDGNRIDISGSLKIGNKLTNRMAGYDPAPKVVKDLHLEATVDGVLVSKVIKEGEKVTLD